MSQVTQLKSGERDFFLLVSRAAFVNPFGDERTELDLRIAGLYPDTSHSDRISKVVHEVSKRIRTLEEEGRSDIQSYSGKDRMLIEKTFLFEMFYLFKDRFDELIQNQIKAGHNTVKIPFFNEALSLMLNRGFTENDFRRFFALGYQLRRAFYFIDRNLVGSSSNMKNLRVDLWNNLFTHNIDFYERYLLDKMEDFSTLILGETGTGKGTAALAIGRSGFIPLDKRKKSFVESFTSSFISLNLSQFSEALIESELFGHKKGAFTGAIEEYKGVFARCSPYGAILLDEIGEVPPKIQIKLLQVLQDRVFTPVGSRKETRFHGRVIAATNRPLEEIRGKGIFRDDFYYRLCSDIITVPPLRQRIQEDPVELDTLLSFTIKKMSGDAPSSLINKVREVIIRDLGKEYPWRGNVRELEQCVRSILLKGTCSGDGTLVSVNHESKLKKGISDGSINAQNLISGYCFLLHDRHGTFEEVARRTGLDRRTVKKYIQEWKEINHS